jgi:hypothetical protein
LTYVPAPGGDKAYIGVMAREVQAVMQAAFVRGNDGFALRRPRHEPVRMTASGTSRTSQHLRPTSAIDGISDDKMLAASSYWAWPYVVGPSNCGMAIIGFAPNVGPCDGK